MVGSFICKADGTVAVQTLLFDASKSVLIDSKTASNGLLSQNVTVTQATGTTTAQSTYWLIKTTGQTATMEVTLATTTSDFAVEGMISAVDQMLKNITDAGATLGAMNKRIELQKSFVTNLTDVIDKGVGRLVDADMNEESTRLKALQTQQQLGIQALSIANGNAQNLLTLFR